MQHLEVSCAVRPIQWPLGVKWKIRVVFLATLPPIQFAYTTGMTLLEVAAAVLVKSVCALPAYTICLQMLLSCFPFFLTIQYKCVNHKQSYAPFFNVHGTVYRQMCILHNQRHAYYIMYFIIINAVQVSGGPSAHHQKLQAYTVL